MKSLRNTFSLFGICAVMLAAAPVTQAASAPRNTANWLQENVSRIVDRQVRVQVAMVKSLGVSPDGAQQSFLATTWANGETGGTILVIVDANRGSSFERKFGTELQLDDKGNVKTKRLDAVAKLNPSSGQVLLRAS